MADIVQYGDPVNPDPHEYIPRPVNPAAATQTQVPYSYSGYGPTWLDNLGSWFSNQRAERQRGIQSAALGLQRAGWAGGEPVPPTGSIWYQSPEARQPHESPYQLQWGAKGMAFPNPP